jgi:hypothetical protein
MKYFTPELHLRLQDFSSDEAMDAAESAWEKARRRYQRALQGSLPRLPKNLRELVESYYLHDADVLGMGKLGQTFVMVLRLDAPPKELLVLNYQLVKSAAINQTAWVSPKASGPVQWLYDEVGVAGGPFPHYTHSILLSNGWEVTLHLSDLRLVRVDAVYPLPGTMLIPVSRPDVSRSA